MRKFTSLIFLSAIFFLVLMLCVYFPLSKFVLNQKQMSLAVFTVMEFPPFLSAPIMAWFFCSRFEGFFYRFVLKISNIYSSVAKILVNETNLIIAFCLQFFFVAGSSDIPIYVLFFFPIRMGEKIGMDFAGHGYMPGWINAFFLFSWVEIGIIVVWVVQLTITAHFIYKASMQKMGPADF